MATRKNAPAPLTARFVLMPLRGLKSDGMKRVDAAAPAFSEAASMRLAVAGSRAAPRPCMKVLHSMAEDGPKLVEMGPEEVAALKVSDPGVRVMPVVRYELARRPVLRVVAPAERARAQGTRAARPPKLTIRFVDARTGRPLRGVQVAAFTHFARREGAGGTSNARGQVALALGGASAKLQVLVAYGPAGYWGLGRRALTLKHGAVFEIEPRA